MRPQAKQRLDLDQQQLYGDIVLMVCEARLKDPIKGRIEGPHLPSNSHSSEHICDINDTKCSEAKILRNKSEQLWSNGLPLCIYTFIVPQNCQAADGCLAEAHVLEKWSVQMHPKRNPKEKPLAAHFLLQAMRSFLCFSQLSAWLAKTEGKFPHKIVYRVLLPGELDLKGDIEDPDGRITLDIHNFPPCYNGKWTVTVTAAIRPRQDSPPMVFCLNCDRAEHSSCDQNDDESTKTSDNTRTSSFSNVDPSSTPVVAINRPTNSVNLSLPPITLPCGSSSVDNNDTESFSASNPLFEPFDDWPERIELALKVRINRLRQSSPVVQSCISPPVRFYISPENEKEDEISPTCSKFETSNNEDSGISVDRSIETTTRQHTNSPSQKILFSSQVDSVIETTIDSGSQSNMFPLVPISSSFTAGRRKTVFSSFTDGSEWWSKTGALTEAQINKEQHSQSTAPSAQDNKKVFHGDRARVSHKSRNLQKCVFNRQFSHTGLPLTSSPAPLKRNQHSFDYDSSLNTVAGLRTALYNEHDSGSSDSESGSSHCKSAPASTNLLGNFEESALNGRIKPFGSIDGFILDLAASGAFCPPHVRFPVTTFFFNISDDNAPSPYLGHCNLELLSKKGYHLPQKGTVQATLFNPQGTVVKMFVVRYDLSDMPSTCQTFVRQRTFFMPSHATLEDARKNRSWLRYLIHLRFATSRSGKLYMHTDIRMLFSRKSELDAQRVEGDEMDSCATKMSIYELRSFNEMPKNPKFSPRKANRPQEIKQSDSGE